VAHVPGAVEIPLAAGAFLESGRFDAAVALGAVIRGETDHYDHVCRMAGEGVMRVMMETGRPVAFGVLTCDTDDQALARCGEGEDNKGFEAALVALEMASLLDGIEA
jgi:6,7-dimethyl-8-ribityllumazine synthase